jgi:hypothetical protein
VIDADPEGAAGIGEPMALLTQREWCTSYRHEDGDLIEEAHLIGDPTLLTAIEGLLNVLPPGVPSGGKKKPDANLAGAANDFEALERLRKLAFPDTALAPKIPEQILLELPDAPDDNEEV